MLSIWPPLLPGLQEQGGTVIVMSVSVVWLCLLLTAARLVMLGAHIALVLSAARNPGMFSRPRAGRLPHHNRAQNVIIAGKITVTRENNTNS